jgi:hypothetical protein
MHAFGIEDERFYFGFDTLGGDILAFPRKSYSRGIADSDYDFAIGANCCVGWSNQGFMRDGLAIRGDGNPGIFRSTYHETEGGRGLRGWCGGPSGFSV